LPEKGQGPALLRVLETRHVDTRITYHVCPISHGLSYLNPIIHHGMDDGQITHSGRWSHGGHGTRCGRKQTGFNLNSAGSMHASACHADAHGYLHGHRLISTLCEASTEQTAESFRADLPIVPAAAPATHQGLVTHAH
jgi:hypothetical protein